MIYYKHKTIDHYYAIVKGYTMKRINTRTGLTGEEIFKKHRADDKTSVLSSWAKVERRELNNLVKDLDLLERIS